MPADGPGKLTRKECTDIVAYLLNANGHAPGQFRALTVRNIDAWYPAFNVQPGQKLYVAPAQRVRIWG